MQFTYAACVETHIDPGDGSGDAQLALSHLSCPAAAAFADMCIAETVKQIGQGAAVSGGRINQIRVFRFTNGIVRTRITTAGLRTGRISPDLIIMGVYLTRGQRNRSTGGKGHKASSA